MGEETQTQKQSGVDARVWAKQLQAQRDEDSNFAKFQIDSSDIIEEIDHFLKGEKRDYTTGQWMSITGNGQPLMNDKGRLAFMLLVQSHVNKVFHLSKFHINDVMRMMGETCTSMILNLCYFSEDMGVDVMYFDFIIDSLDHFLFAICMSAEAGGMREHLGTIQKLIERIGFTQVDGKKGKETMLGGG